MLENTHSLLKTNWDLILLICLLQLNVSLTFSLTFLVSLFFSAAPKIKSEIKDMEAHADLTIKMEIEVDGTPKPTVAFYKDGKVVKQNDRIKVVEEATKHTLVIEKSTLKDAGKCKFLNLYPNE